MRFVGALVVWIVVAIVAFFAFAFSGVYPVGADVPHWQATRWTVGLVREHAVERRLANIKPPPLDDPALIKLGAEHYAEMCVECHLAPGAQESELRVGLYPEPPNLTKFAPDPAEAFWIIKHGLKMTAMPAWGKTHNDREIWAMVAYLQKQPKMTAAEFHALTAGVPDVKEHGAPSASAPSLPMPAAAASPR